MKDVAALVLALAVAGAVLFPALEGGFLTDDYVITRLVTHGTLTAGESKPPSLGSFFAKPETPGTFQLYRPLIAVSYALNTRASGTDQHAFRLVDLALHLLGGAVLFLLARVLVPSVTPWAAALGAGFFLLSPVQMEVVNWTAARTETVSWLLGGLALAWKARRPETVIVPAMAAAAAVLAKESALVFLPALALMDWASPHRDRTEAAATRLGRAVPLLVLIAAYFGLRRWMFGSLLGSAYGGREVGTVVADGAVERIMTSLTTLGGPVSRYAEHLLPTDALHWSLLGATTAALALGLGTWVRRAPRGVLVALFVFAVPFAMGTALNVIDDRLVNSRAAYTPVAMLGLAVAVGASGAGWRLAPAGLLVALSALASAPVIDLYVEANRDVEASLSELREAAGGAEPTVRRVAMLGWIDRDHLGGGFTLAGAHQCGLLRPFSRRDLEVAAVAAAGVDPARGYLRPFPSLFPGEERELALVRTRIADGAVAAELLWAGHTATGEHAVSSRAPRPNEHLVLDAAAPTSIEFRFLARGPVEDARFELEVFQPSGRTLPGAVPLDPVVEKTTGVGAVMSATIDIPEGLWPELVEERPFAWGVRVLDASGATVAATGLRLMWVRVAR